MAVKLAQLKTAPVTAPVTITEAKQRLVIEHSDDDTLLKQFIAAATDWAEQYTGQKLMLQTWHYYFDSFASALEIDAHQITDLKIFYADANNIEQEYNSANYYVDEVSHPTNITPVSAWPTTYNKPNAVRVEVTHGYEQLSDVPDAIKTGILLLVGHLDNNREGSSTQPLKEIPLGVQSFLNPYRLNL